MKFDEFMRRMMSLDAAQIARFFEEALEENKEEFLALNRSQLSNHMTSKGTPITPPYTPAYAKRKGFKVPDLKVTGEFHKSIEVEFHNGKITVKSDLKLDDGFPLADHLAEKYSEDIFQLTEENVKKFERQYLYIPVIKKVKNALHL